MDLRNSIALLTGASRGIGPHIARALVREGAHVAVAARSLPVLEAVAADLRSSGARVVALDVDVGQPEACASLVARAEEALGPIDLLVNNAGVETEGQFLSLDPEAIIGTVAVNLTGAILLARHALPGMLARGRGHVVNVASLGGKKGAPFEAVYCATKAGLIEWTSALRLELEGTGVSFSAICPGYVTGEGMFAKFGVSAPRTIGSCTPEQVAAAVVDAVLRDLPEVIVNSMPVRPLLALNALSPRLGRWLLQAMGITAFQRRKVGGAEVR
jgi:short-subunit dehydrogenase